MEKVLVLAISLLITTFTFAQYDYHVTLSADHADKTTISEIEQLLITSNRSISGNIFSFSSSVNYQTEFIESAFQSIGKPAIYVGTSRGQVLSSEKAGGNNCDLAENLCSNASLPGNSGGFGVQELPNNNTSDGCLSVEHQSSWYYLNVLTPGTLQMRISPANGADDYDFAIWGPFTAATAAANCPPITSPVRCSFAATGGDTGMRSSAGDVSEGAGGDRWVSSLNVITGQIYILLVDNFSVSGSGYTIDFNWGLNLSTATLGCISIPLPVEISEFSGTKLSNENKLTWTTETEINNSHFVLETTPSPELDNWEYVTTVQGAGNSTEKIDYVFDHYSFTKGAINYYRLTQVDNDGSKRVYSSLAAVDNRVSEKPVLRVVNLLGQEVSEDEKGMVIILFEDGTSEKIYR